MFPNSNWFKCTVYNYETFIVTAGKALIIDIQLQRGLADQQMRTYESS